MKKLALLVVVCFLMAITASAAMATNSNPNEGPVTTGLSVKADVSLKADVLEYAKVTWGNSGSYDVGDLNGSTTATPLTGSITLNVETNCTVHVTVTGKPLSLNGAEADFLKTEWEDNAAATGLATISTSISTLTLADATQAAGSGNNYQINYKISPGTHIYDHAAGEYKTVWTCTVQQ